MDDTQLIQQIVETYELPERKKLKIMNIALRRISELGLSSFDAKYKYIAELVEQFSLKYEERRNARLDHSITTNGESRTLIDTIQVIIEETPSETEDSLDNILSTVRTALNAEEMKIIEDIIKSGNLDTNSLLIGLASEPEKIKERLEALARYQREKGLLYPERRIITVNLDPQNPWIRWGNRKYPNGALYYFKEHSAVYGRMRRVDLFRFDSGLYKKLEREKTLIEAIPTIDKNQRSSLKESEILRRLNAYTTYGGNACRASRALKLNRVNLKKTWGRYGLKAQGRPYLV